MHAAKAIETVLLDMKSGKFARRNDGMDFEEYKKVVGYDKWEEKEYGSEDIKSIEVVGQGDVTGQLQFIAPDDGNKDDKTVVDVRMRKAIAPGAYVQFKIAFRTKFPETQARSGWKRDFVLGG